MKNWISASRCPKILFFTILEFWDDVEQVLITKNLIDDREQFINTTQALNELLSQNIIPVINENDIVATEELKFGDNDRLSAIVSIIVNNLRCAYHGWEFNEEGHCETIPQMRMNWTWFGCR